MEKRLHLPPERIDRARELAKRIVAPVQVFIEAHTTVTVERATLRLAGADGADADGVPVPNLVVDQLQDCLEDGALKYWVNALLRTGEDVAGLNRRVADGLRVADLPLADPAALDARASELVTACTRRVRGNRSLREERLARYAGKNHAPLLYVIVATGNIHEDVKQARAAAEQGADVIAVIRTTAQSLLDYVPYGATTEGFGGTYATQENFRIMRAASTRSGAHRPVHPPDELRSGLCMPEIAAMGALERLDMMLNDSMYGILFRDINMYRTFVDQHFSRMINAYAGIIINTGEDNYLTTADAVEKAYTVLAFAVPQRALRLRRRSLSPHGPRARLRDRPDDPERLPDGDRPGAHGPRDLPRGAAQVHAADQAHDRRHLPGLVQNAMFNFVSQLTGQAIHLLGMLTEAIHTPFMQDRFLAVENARYVMNTMADWPRRSSSAGTARSCGARRRARGDRGVPREDRRNGPHARDREGASSPTSSAPATVARASTA